MQKRIQKIFNIFDLLNETFSLIGIRLTAGQLSLILDTSYPSILFSRLKKAGELIDAGYCEFYEGHFIVSLHQDSYHDNLNEDVRFLIDVVSNMADIICACTGNEIYIDKDQIKCYLDVESIDIDQFTRINELFEDIGLIILSHRPYIVFNRDIEENILIEEIGGD